MAQNDYVDGFGVIDDEGLKIATVSGTRRAAIVNWLCTEAGIMPPRTASDEEIERVWLDQSGDAVVMPVRVYVQ